MAIKTSGTLSFEGDIVAEFGGNRPHAMSEYYRNGAYVTSNNTNVPTSGAISFSNFYGGTAQFNFTITSSIQEANLYTLAIAAGWDELAPLVVDINSTVYLWSASTSIGGLIIPSAFNVPVIINNYGKIIGKGGNGASGINNSGAAGGPAIQNSAFNVQINNKSGAYIAGGGGGGQSGGYSAGGGGAGGGTGGTGVGVGTPSGAGGAGGAIGQSGADGVNTRQTGSNGKGGGSGGGGSTGEDNGSSEIWMSGAGGGGRILPGVGGDGGGWREPDTGGDGGSGGAAGVDGRNQYGSEDGGGGGGGWGARGGDRAGGTGGGLGGAAISGTSVILTNAGTIYGST